MNSNALVLTGLDGSNPLAFLAAIGTLRLLSLQVGAQTALHWRRDTAWRPVLSGLPPEITSEELCRLLLEAPGIPAAALSEVLGKNINVPADVFCTLIEAAEQQLLGSTGEQRLAEFASAFGSEACIDKRKERIHYTSFCFITGSGHQNFVDAACSLVAQTRSEHLTEALFGPWRRIDRGLSFRWDPADAAEYALRWDDPSKAGASGVWGANRLAIEALPMFPCQPRQRELLTTGFRSQRDEPEFTWPLWGEPVGCDVVRSLLAFAPLHEAQPDRCSLASMGIVEVFRASRVRIGQGANFKVSFRPAKSV